MGPQKQQTGWINSLGFILLVWFLAISIIPLSIFGYYTYQERIELLGNKYKKELENTVILHEAFIKNWFKYRTNDISIWSQDQHNIKLLSLLSTLYKQSKDIDTFLESYEYGVITDKYEGDLLRLIKTYDYIYDFLLIDLNGNILYSAKKEDDLGTNLLDKSPVSDNLAASFAQSIETGGIYFSDLEYYHPSGNIKTGFLTAPIIDDRGNLIGVMAVQIDSEPFEDTFNGKSEGRYSYLLGEDDLLRSDISSDKRALTVKIGNQHIQHWNGHRSENDPIEHDENYINYLNPENKMVIGMHKQLDLLGVKWLLISEIEHNLIFADKNRLLERLTLFLLVTIAIIILIASYLAKKITQPIRELTKASKSFAHGDIDISMIQNFKGEVGELASAFRKMLISITDKETELKRFAIELEERVKQEVELNAIKDKQMLKQSKIAHRKLKKSLDQFSENVIASRSDKNGIIIFASKALCKVSGYSEEELLGQPHSILRHPDMPSEVFEEIWKTIQSGKPWDGEIMNMTKDSRTYWVRSSIIPEFDNKHNIIGYTSIRHDITSQKAKEQFVDNMSHELRTPLNAIIGFGSILSERLKDATDLKFINFINSSASSLLTLVDDILDLSKIKNSKFSINPYAFNAYKEISEHAEQFAGLAAQKSLSLQSDISTDLNAKFFGDWIRIGQIILNLISNAIKFTPKGGNIHYTAAYEKDCIMFTISDNGIGMSKEVQDRVFIPFEQADGSTTREYGGTGLGLSIVQSLVDLMKGKIEIESEEGKGTSFKVTIPLKKLGEDAEVSKQDVPDTSVNKKTLSGVHLLVVEDDMANQLLIEVVLAQLGISYDIANDGEEALKMYDPAEHQLILMDIKMPKMDGVEAMQKIRQKFKQSCGPIIALTANAMNGSKQRLLDLGMDGYLSKPIDKDQLYDTIKSVLKTQ